MRYLIEHETRLAFASPVREHHCELRLAPRSGESQRVLRCEIEVEPEVELREHVDCFGNRVHRMSLMAPHAGIAARLRAEVETRLENPFDYAPLDPAQERAWFEQQLRGDPPLYDYLLHRSPAVPELGALGALGAPGPEAGRPLLESVQRASAWAGERFAYQSGATDVHAPLADFVARGGGVCQDFAHLLVALVRSWGFPARYVAGYVDPGAEREAGSEQSTHAWAEVLIPGAGWRGFDATRGLVADALYVATAVGRDSRDAAPIRGTFKGDDRGEEPRVQLRVARQQ